MAANLAALHHQFPAAWPVQALPLPPLVAGLGSCLQAGATFIGAALGAFELKGEFRYLEHFISPFHRMKSFSQLNAFQSPRLRS